MYSPVAVFLEKRNREGPCNEDLFNATFLASEVLNQVSQTHKKEKLFLLHHPIKKYP